MMTRIDLDKRSVGVNFNSHGEAEIQLWSPFAKTAELLIDDSKKLPLDKQEFGYWSLTTDEIKPGTRYKFILDESRVFPDPASLFQPEGVHGPSEAVDLKAFDWTDQYWSNISLHDYLIYELHTGTFTPGGTFAGVAEKLDHLKTLGVNAIEIMPVAQFPGTRNWGYDGVFPFAVQNSYGGIHQLKTLVNMCHQNGLAVVLDVVYNHLGPEGNYFSEFGPYFTEKYNTPWGSALNFDDAWSDEVRFFFIENALMWFRDFHIDALRLDAVHAIKDFGPRHILSEMKQAVNALSEKTGRKYYLIAEVDLNDSRFIDPLDAGGFGMDAQWIDEFHHALRVTAGGDRQGYYSDFNGIAHLAKAYNDAYVYDGTYSPHRCKIFGTSAKNNPGQQFVVFSQNHDQVGNRMLGERISQLVSFEMQKLMAGAVMVSPYLPMLFMGEEWSESNPFLYFVSHSDPQLIEAVRNGRKEEFADFHSSGELPDPQSEGIFLQSKLQWNLPGVGRHQIMFRYYQNLLATRKQEPALATLNRENLRTEHNEEDKTLMLWRWHETQHILCIMNFSPIARQVTIYGDQDQWHKVFDSADPGWLGPGAAPESVFKDSIISIQPESIIIYKTHVQSCCHLPISVS